MKALMNNHLITLKVEQLNDHKNQYLITLIDEEGNEVKCFQSYKTPIAYYYPEQHRLEINWDKWDYSKTTIRHLEYFITNFTPYLYKSKHHFLWFILNSDEVTCFKDE